MRFLDSGWYFGLLIIGAVVVPLFLTQCMGMHGSSSDIQQCGTGPLKYDC